MEIADAALSPDPLGDARPTRIEQRAPQGASAQNAAAPRARSMAEGGRRFRESFFSRLSRLGGALWLEFTGVFFGIFALVGAQGVWRMRAALHANASLQMRQKLFLALAVTVAFAYFCVSGFVRARRRERGEGKRS